MNIYEMAKWIKENDSSTGMRYSWMAYFLLDQHTACRIESKALFEMLKTLMKRVIDDSIYIEVNQHE